MVPLSRTLRTRRRVGRAVAPYALLVPALAFVVFLLIAAGFLFRYSFNSWSPTTGMTSAWSLAATAGGVFKIVDDTPEFTLGSTQYCVGAAWKVMITNSAPNAVESRFAEGTEGSYTLRAEIGGLISNRLAVVVSGCRGARRR